MPREATFDELAGRVKKIALALPSVVENPVSSRRGRRGNVAVAVYAVGDQYFARVFHLTDPAGKKRMWLWVRTDWLQRQALLSDGHRFFSSGGRAVGVFLEAGTDWDEIRELITDSYLKIAPRKLAAQVEASLSGRDGPAG